jgi:hypothetical protein
MDQHTGHTINGKHTDVGHTVRYTGTDGTHEATIVDLAEDGTATLTTPHNGQQHTGVKHGTAGSVHTWDHAPTDD